MHVIQLFTIKFGEYSLWSTKYTQPPGATRDSQLSLRRNEKGRHTIQSIVMSLTGSVIGSSRLVVWMGTSLFLLRVMRCTCSLTTSFSNWLILSSLLSFCAILADITFSLNFSTKSDTKWAVGNIPATEKFSHSFAVLRSSSLSFSRVSRFSLSLVSWSILVSSCCRSIQYTVPLTSYCGHYNQYLFNWLLQNDK